MKEYHGFAKIGCTATVDHFHLFNLFKNIAK